MLNTINKVVYNKPMRMCQTISSRHLLLNRLGQMPVIYFLMKKLHPFSMTKARPYTESPLMRLCGVKLRIE